MLRPFALACACVVLVACQPGPEPEVRRAEPAPAALSAGPDAGGCWASDRVPAQSETVFDRAADGSQIAREVERRPAEERLFAVPCADQMDSALIASLQRAMAARGLHGGAVSGVYDAPTAEAVRRYQAPLGLDSAILSLDAARMLGLIAVGRGGL